MRQCSTATPGRGDGVTGSVRPVVCASREGNKVRLRSTIRRRGSFVWSELKYHYLRSTEGRVEGSYRSAEINWMGCLDIVECVLNVVQYLQ